MTIFPPGRQENKANFCCSPNDAINKRSSILNRCTVSLSRAVVWTVKFQTSRSGRLSKRSVTSFINQSAFATRQSDHFWSAGNTSAARQSRLLYFGVKANFRMSFWIILFSLGPIETIGSFYSYKNPLFPPCQCLSFWKHHRDWFQEREDPPDRYQHRWLLSICPFSYAQKRDPHPSVFR